MHHSVRSLRRFPSVNRVCSCSITHHHRLAIPLHRILHRCQTNLLKKFQHREVHINKLNLTMTLKKIISAAMGCQLFNDLNNLNGQSHCSGMANSMHLKLFMFNVCQ